MNGKEYYDWAKSKGIDLNYYGDWQKQYAKMVMYITKIIPTLANMQSTSPTILDIGCGTGINLRAFKEAGGFANYLGVDKNEYLLNLGFKNHGFNETQLKCLDIGKEPLPFEDNSIIFIHSSQVFEHIQDDNIDFVLDEIKRVMHPKGMAFITLAAIKVGQSIDQYTADPTHINLKSEVSWVSAFKKKFKIDNSVRAMFKKSKHSPTNDEKTFNDYYGSSWTMYKLIKK